MATPKKRKEDLLKVGRPSSYTPELGMKICRAISTSVDSLKKICARNPDFPNRECIWSWRLDFPEFANLYNEARRTQADLMAEELNEIADDDSGDLMFGELGTPKQNTEFIARSRLRIDTRKWIACKLLPKVYGDKTITEATIHITHEDAIKELE